MVAEIKEVSIQDVARHCGVSVATVLHVINRKPVVRQEKPAPHYEKNHLTRDSVTSMRDQ